MPTHRFPLCVYAYGQRHLGVVIAQEPTALACTTACVHVCMTACVHVCMCKRNGILRGNQLWLVPMCACIHIHVSAYTYTHIEHILVCMHVCICNCVCACVYVRIHAHIDIRIRAFHQAQYTSRTLYVHTTHYTLRASCTPRMF